MQNLSFRQPSIFRTICASSQILGILQRGIPNDLLLFLSPAAYDINQEDKQDPLQTIHELPTILASSFSYRAFLD